MSFESFFISRIADKSAEIICKHDSPKRTVKELPSSRNLGIFCFPLGVQHVAPKEYMAADEFTFTLTGGDGKKLHGFCRSFLPPRQTLSGSLRRPQVLCIITQHLWVTTYFKVLQIAEALLKQSDVLTGPGVEDLPYISPTARFLDQVAEHFSIIYEPGQVVQVPLPRTPSLVNVSPPRRFGSDFQPLQPLRSTPEFVELEIPPSLGNGQANAGLPLARLLWHLPARAMVALVEALLLERRILMVAQDRDTVSAAVHGAAALLYPFSWQHIYLPLLPLALKDYLAAPMPFLMGLHAPDLFMPTLRSGSLEEVVMVDLDRGCMYNGSGQGLPKCALPWADQLRDAFDLLKQTLRSPVEHESTPYIISLMQEYFVKLLGRYHGFIREDADEGSVLSGEPHSNGERAAGNGPNTIRAHGYCFDYDAFVASYSSTKARALLLQLRQSQCLEVFINERLLMASQGFADRDDFESRIEATAQHNSISKAVVSAGSKSVSRMNAMIQKTSKAVKVLRQSYSESRSRQSSAELPTANGRQHAATLHPQSQHEKRREPPSIPADHQFLSDDETSGSGSDEEHSSAEARQQRKPQTHSNGRPSHQAVPSLPGKVTPVQQEAGFSPAIQDHLSLSLLDMPASTPPVASRGSEQPWSELLDWSMPAAEASASLKQGDERPRNGWAGLGQTLGNTLDSSCLPLSAATESGTASPPVPMPVPGSHNLEHSTPSLSSRRPMDPFDALEPLYSPCSQPPAGESQQPQQSSPSLSTRHSGILPAMQPMPSSFNRSPARGPSVSVSAPELAPQDWLRQSEAISSLTIEERPGSDALLQARELYKVDLQAASSSPLSPQMQSLHGPAAPSGSSATDCGMSRAVSARPFSTQHSADWQRAGHPQEYALPWLEISEASAASHASRDCVSNQVSPGGQESGAGQVQMDDVQPLSNPFSGQQQAPAPQAWTFQASGKRSMSLLDM